MSSPGGSDERISVPYEEALGLLPGRGPIHTFMNPRPGVLFGADWSRADIRKAFKRYGVELSGENATRTGHGLVFWDGSRHIFVQTRKDGGPPKSSKRRKKCAARKERA